MHTPPPRNNTPYEILEHRVEPGQTFAAIARIYDTTIDSLCEVNEMKPYDPLYAGQMLKVRVPKGFRGHTAPGDQAPADAKLVRVEVQAGDTLFSLASYFGVTVGEIMLWNNIRPGETIKVGQILTIIVQP